jgi:hypothetical protein
MRTSQESEAPAISEAGASGFNPRHEAEAFQTRTPVESGRAVFREVLAMRKKFGAALALFAFAFALFFSASAQGQGASTLKDDLNKQYKMVKLGSNAGSTVVTDAGTVLVVQQAGLLGIPPNGVIPCPAHFKDGSLHAPSMLCKAALRNTGKDFANGDKVYPMKIDVNVQKEEVAFTVLECDTCNNTDPPTYFHSQVVFQFAKGYLETAGSDQVEDTIAKLFAADTSNNNGGDQQQGNQGQQQGDQGQAQGGQQQQQPAQPPPPPASVQLGQSPDQVVAAIGQPDKIITLGAKQIYVYKDLKVTFVNGKVTDAQ